MFFINPYEAVTEGKVKEMNILNTKYCIIFNTYVKHIC